MSRIGWQLSGGVTQASGLDRPNMLWCIEGGNEPATLPTAVMPVHQIDPLQDPRWREFVQCHPAASAFHTPEWLEALRQSYGYEPVVFTTSQAGDKLDNGMVFCHVNSVLTGRRLVSLPFSDHCESLTRNDDEAAHILAHVGALILKTGAKYAEIRPLHGAHAQTGFMVHQRYYFHKIDLTTNTDLLFERLHKSCFQRKIHRAEREKLRYDCSSGDVLLSPFYRLFTATRRRHGLPPPPLHWLRNVLDGFGSNASIGLISKEGQPLAGMLTIRHRDTIIYKYGGSDIKRSNLGGMALLFWKTMCEAKAAGRTVLDLGRCDSDNEGLITYKRRLGSQESILTYMRAPTSHGPEAPIDWKMPLFRRVCAHAPDFVRIALGNLLYRHAG